RHPALVAQLLPHLAGAVGLDQPLLDLAAGIQRAVFERRHQLSLVTRRTSSIVESPAITLRQPSSRIPGVRLRACRSSACSLARSWIISRMSSSTTTSS